MMKNCFSQAAQSLLSRLTQRAPDNPGLQAATGAMGELLETLAKDRSWLAHQAALLLSAFERTGPDNVQEALARAP